MPPKSSKSSTITPGPTFYPTVLEFEDTYGYLAKIQPIAAPFGICKIVPPQGWQPGLHLPLDFAFMPRIMQLDRLDGHNRLAVVYMEKLASFHGQRRTITVKSEASASKPVEITPRWQPYVKGVAVDCYRLKVAVEKLNSNATQIAAKEWDVLASQLGLGNRDGLDIRDYYKTWVLPYEQFLAAVKLQPASQLAEELKLHVDMKNHAISVEIPSNIRTPADSSSSAQSKTTESRPPGLKRKANTSHTGSDRRMRARKRSDDQQSGQQFKSPWEYNLDGTETCNVCDLQQDHVSMILCDKCEMAYHYNCLEESSRPPQFYRTWHCHKCQGSGSSTPVDSVTSSISAGVSEPIQESYSSRKRRNPSRRASVPTDRTQHSTRQSIKSEEKKKKQFKSPWNYNLTGKELCQICTLKQEDSSMILCDKCDLGYHYECLDNKCKPPHFYRQWFCQPCRNIVCVPVSMQQIIDDLAAQSPAKVEPSSPVSDLNLDEAELSSSALSIQSDEMSSAEVLIPFVYNFQGDEQCISCNTADRHEIMIRCDECNQGYHWTCISPPPPQDYQEWFCLTCLRSTSAPYGFKDSPLTNIPDFKKSADKFKQEWFKNTGKNKQVTESQVEAEFWKLVSDPTRHISVEYGADLSVNEHGSGFPLAANSPRNHYTKTDWNLNNIGTPLLNQRLEKGRFFDISIRIFPE